MKQKLVTVSQEVVEAVLSSGLFPPKQKQGGKIEEADYSHAINLSTEFYLELRKIVMAQIKGVFSQKEIIALCDCLNSTYFEIRFAVRPEILLASVQDACKLDGLATLHEIEETELLAKINNLTELQSVFLQFEISNWWARSGSQEDILKELI